MSVVDVLLILVMLLFAVSGYRQGFVVGIMSFLGFFSGALIGLQAGPALAGHFTDATARVVVSLAMVFGLAMLGQALGGWLGAHLRRGITGPVARTVDDIGGALISVVAVAVVAWLVAVPLGSSSLPGLARSVRNSTVLGAINEVMPDQARTLSEALRRTVDTRGFPNVFGDLVPTRVPQVPPPDGSLAASATVTNARPSVVKVRGTAPSCSRRIEGSGFVYAPEHVMTNAHVVAGTRQITVESGDGVLPGRVVVYDPERDLAVIYVPGLRAPPLTFTTNTAARGSGAIVLGYPLDGPFDAQPARIRDMRDITGPDIYNSGDVTREIYSLRALVRSGNSGGPLISPNGKVLGVIFAAAADDRYTGFAVTAGEANPVAVAGRSRTSAVGTGGCA